MSIVLRVLVVASWFVMLASVGGADEFGRAIEIVGDLDGDGRAEVVVSDPQFPDRNLRSGCVWVVSLARERVLLASTSESPRAEHGSQVAVLEGDSQDATFVVSSFDEPSSVRVVAFDLAGRTKWRARVDGGRNWRMHRVVSTPDVDGDRIDDVIATSPTCERGGRVSILSGRDGRTLRVIDAPQGSRNFGRAVATVGRSRGDGHVWIVCAYARGANEGAVSIFDLGTGALVREILSARGEPHFGTSLAFHPRAIFDGERTLAIGSSQQGRDPSYVRERAILVGIESGNVHLEQQWNERDAHFGSSLAFAACADGVPLWIVGATYSDVWSGAAQVMRIERDARPFVLRGSPLEEKFADVLRNGGDVDHDGFDEIAVTVGNVENSQPRSVRWLDPRNGVEKMHLSRAIVEGWCVERRVAHRVP